MAYRGIRGSDPFASKTTRNERFAQMSKQEQLIEQKKREIQAKVENQKKKETEEALKKLQGVSGNTRLGLGNKSNFQSGQHKGSRKPFWKSNQEQRWKRDSSHLEEVVNSNKVLGSMNIFSNDGSFLDQFKKLSGVKEVKSKKEEDSSVTANNNNDTKSPLASAASRKHESDTDWGTWDAPADKQVVTDPDQHTEDTELLSCQDQEKSEDRDQNQEQDQDRDQRNEELHNSERLGTSHWFQQERTSNGAWQQQGRDDSGVAWHGQDSPPPSSTTTNSTNISAPNRASSPYSPSRVTPDNKEVVASINLTPTTSTGPIQYTLPNIHHSSAIPLLTPPPPPQQHFIAYTAPPPPLHSIPPPSPLQPHSIPPPSPMQPHTIPTPPPHAPPTLSIHPSSTPIIQQSLTSIQPPPPTIQQPPPTIQQPPPSIQPPTTIQQPTSTLQPPPPTLPTSSSLPPHMMQHPPPLLRHTVPPPGVLQTRTLGPALPALVTPLLQHPLPPPGLPPTASAVRACPPLTAVSSICTSTLTGVSPAAVAVMQAGGPNGGQSSDEPAGPAADEARNHLARMVAQCGDDIEHIILVRNPDDPSLWFLNDKDCAAYLKYRQLVEKFRMEIKNEDEEAYNKEIKVEGYRQCVKEEQNEFGSVFFQPGNNTLVTSVKIEQTDDKIVTGLQIKQEDIRRQDQEDDNSHQSEASSKRSGDESDEGQMSVSRRRKRRSRWAPESDKVNVVPGTPIVGTGGNGVPIAVPLGTVQPSAVLTSGVQPVGAAQFLSKVTRTDPALVQYAVQAFGTSNLSEDDWKKAEDHYKINLLYQDMLRKRQELERLQRAGKFKYEYDSDEETDGGTWEHRLRLQEMEATQRWAEELTKKAEGKHHIGDFLPPDELERFLEKYSALKEGREPDLSDYKEFKLKEDNIGFQMLQKLGWTEGQGLGSEGHGIVDPVNKASSRPENQGLGVERPEDVTRGDDEYDAYRKRMMLAYRFRPNPLNNPRRPYY